MPVAVADHHERREGEALDVGREVDVLALEGSAAEEQELDDRVRPGLGEVAEDRQAGLVPAPVDEVPVGQEPVAVDVDDEVVAASQLRPRGAEEVAVVDGEDVALEVDPADGDGHGRPEGVDEDGVGVPFGFAPRLDAVHVDRRPEELRVAHRVQADPDRVPEPEGLHPVDPRHTPEGPGRELDLDGSGPGEDRRAVVRRADLGGEWGSEEDREEDSHGREPRLATPRI